MPLIDFKTDFKSLKYGMDRPGGGSSDEPYITTPIPKDNQTGLLNLGSDFVLRGGALAPIRAAQDVSRLTQMFFSTKGVLFTAKQNLLSRASVKTEASQGLAYGMGSINAGIYYPTSTLLQAGGGFLGTHFPLLGMPSGNLALIKYEDFHKNNKDLNNNRLLNLRNFSIVQNEGDYTDISDKVSKYYNRSDVEFKPQDLFKSVKNSKDGYKLENNSIRYYPYGNVLLSYTGGPGSLLGVGNTEIRKADHLTLKSSKDTRWGDRVFTFDQKLIDLANPTQGNPSVIFEDFRKKVKTLSKEAEVNLASSDYNNFNLQTTFGISDPGRVGVDRTGEDTKESYTKDSLSLYPLYKAEKKNDEVKDDLIDFYIAVINNDTPILKTWIHFRAYISGFTDSYNAAWDSFKYVGRGENFYKYGGYDRDIGLNFKVAVQSGAEQKVIYEKLNYLASIMTPDYSQSGFMRGNIIKLTIGDYLKDVPGVLTSLVYTIPEDSPWDIARSKDSIRSDMKQLPHVIEVSSFSFKPIENFLPRTITLDDRNELENTNVKFIGY